MSAPVAPAAPDGAAPPAPAEKPAELVRKKLELCMPNYRDTFVASVIGTLFMFGGLMALCISEAGIPGLPKQHWLTLLFRMIGWVALYFLPVQVVGIGNLRGFCLYGVEPGNSSMVCWRPLMGPTVASEMAEELGGTMSPRRAALLRC
eukprot:Skav221964  [mRNA]  locus=scaffold195:841300:844675:- [translate_table: standard]